MQVSQPPNEEKGAEKMKKCGIFYAFHPSFSLKRLTTEVHFCKN